MLPPSPTTRFRETPTSSKVITVSQVESTAQRILQKATREFSDRNTDPYCVLRTAYCAVINTISWRVFFLQNYFGREWDLESEEASKIRRREGSGDIYVVLIVFTVSQLRFR
eukprot:1346574-Amorphochlora_amoeboformis.AAC.1